MNVNFAFIRHGSGCHNVMTSLANNNIITVDQKNALLGIVPQKGITVMNDPVLTELGVDASIRNGCIISKILQSLYKLKQNPDLNMDVINIVGCSPLIRCMETSYYMTRKWSNPPDKIYVFPHLRELDESSDNPYSLESKQRLNTVSAYAIKTLSEQKNYLKRIGLLEYFDFTFVEKFQQERLEPGSISNFLIWFFKNFLPAFQVNKNLNVFVTTHAGVLHEFSKQGFVNNSGFVVNVKNKDSNISVDTLISLNKYLPKWFFNDYDNYNNVNYYCPSNRCEELCALTKVVPNTIKHIKTDCEEQDVDSSKKLLTGHRRGPVKPPVSTSASASDSSWDF